MQFFFYKYGIHLMALFRQNSFSVRTQLDTIPCNHAMASIKTILVGNDEENDSCEFTAKRCENQRMTKNNFGDSNVKKKLLN